MINIFKKQQDTSKYELEIAQLKAEILTLKNQNKKPRLLMMQLGTYIPDFKDLSMQNNDFKRALQNICNNLSESEHWKFLMTQLKQEQVNKFLFEEYKSEDFVRGTINGLYIVEDLVNSLGVKK